METIRYVDEKSGRIFHIDPGTGESREYHNMDVEIGSRIISPDEQKRQRAAKVERERRAIERGGKREEKFVFVDANIDFSGMRPATITRLIYLSTYAGYSEGRKRKSPLTRRGVHLKRKDLADVLQISERHADIQALFNAMGNCAKETKYKVKTVLSMILCCATEDGVIARNPILQSGCGLMGSRAAIRCLIA